MRSQFALLELVGVVTALVVSAAACQQPPPSQSRTAPAATVGPPAPSFAPTPPRLLEGTFDAISTTAMGITGDLTLTVTTLKFSKGLVYETTPAASLQASAVYAKNAGTWVDLLGVEAKTPIEVRAVASETVGAQATNGGLCAPEKTTFVALASTTGTRAPDLRLAAFKSSAAPGASIAEGDLCGTFTYAPR